MGNVVPYTETYARMKLKYVLLWVFACVVLLATLVIQRHMDMRLAQEEVHQAAVTQARDLAEIFAREIMLQRSKAGGLPLDETIVRPVVFAMMDRPEVIACGVFGTDRLLEAQMRKPDGSLAPLSDMNLSGHWEWGFALREGGETLGRIWIELDPRPWQSRSQKLADKSMWHVVALVQAGAVLFFLGLLVVWKIGARKDDQD